MGGTRHGVPLRLGAGLSFHISARKEITFANLVRKNCVTETPLVPARGASLSAGVFRSF